MERSTARHAARAGGWLAASILLIHCGTHQQVELAMSDSIPYQILKTGFRSPPPKASLPELFVLHSWEALDRHLTPIPGQPRAFAIDWDKQVALLALASVGAGLDDTPEVKSFTYDDSAIRLVVHLRQDPNPQALDVTTQPWILLAVAKETFEKNLRIIYQVEGQGQGTVSDDK
jgi:hypothetical protein